MPRVVLHGVLGSIFHPGLTKLLGSDFDLRLVPEEIESDEDKRVYASADVIVGLKFKAQFPRPAGLKLFHITGAGFDAIEFAALPPGAVVCNCFGHENAIAEYVMAALLNRLVPLAIAGELLRRGDWSYRSGPSRPPRGELAGATTGLLGFGHIGKAIATRAKAFGMTVHVANRSPVSPSPEVDGSFSLNDLKEFWGSFDYLVASLPLAPETENLISTAAFAAMRPNAVVVNVGRGPTINEGAFYEALRSNRIGGAVIDTWYNYPTPEKPTCFPSAFPFQELPNVTMTPHMSAWSTGMIARRSEVVAGNIRSRLRGEPCVNVLWPR